MNNKEPQYETMPEHFMLCFNDECELADECLHRLAARSGQHKDELVTAVNPARCSGKSCRHFMPNKVVMMAYGMVDSFHEVKADHIASLRNTLINHFGRGSYYLRRPSRRRNSSISAAYSVSMDMRQNSTEWKKKQNGCSTNALYYQYNPSVLAVQRLCTDDTEGLYDNKMT